MGAKTGISWTESTWTPIRARVKPEAVAGDYSTMSRLGWHCTKVSDGCTNCYAEDLNIRLGTGERYLAGSPVELYLDQQILDQPLRWKKARRIFVCSMTDLFQESIPDKVIANVWEVMEDERCEQHRFQVLTKRVERMRKMLALWRQEWAPAEHIWCGVSIENRKTLDRAWQLLGVHAAVKFLSIEPLLEDIGDISPLLREAGSSLDYHQRVGPDGAGARDKIDWAIIGGESGKNARPCDLRWIRSIVKQCKDAGVACFVKQLGSNSVYPAIVDGEETLVRLHGRDRKGADPAEWPTDLRVQEYPC